MGDPETYEWTGPGGLGVQRSLNGSMWIQVGAGLVFLTEQQLRALVNSDGLVYLLELVERLREQAGLPRVLCWNCGETDPEYVADSCSRCGVQVR